MLVQFNHGGMSNDTAFMFDKEALFKAVKDAVAKYKETGEWSFASHLHRVLTDEEVEAHMATEDAESWYGHDDQDDIPTLIIAHDRIYISELPRDADDVSTYWSTSAIHEELGLTDTPKFVHKGEEASITFVDSVWENHTLKITTDVKAKIDTAVESGDDLLIHASEFEFEDDGKVEWNFSAIMVSGGEVSYFSEFETEHCVGVSSMDLADEDLDD